MNGELLLLIDAIVREKGIDREVLIQAIESALGSAARKTLGLDETQEVLAVLDRDHGSLTVNINGKSLPAAEFSRIGAQTAKQVIMQKIREAERETIFTEFQGKVSDIITGTVHRFERGDIIVDLGRTEGILPKAERIPFEQYELGDRLQACIIDVRKGAKGAEVVLSRASEAFIRGLFSLEVPEINEGIVEIKAIAREPGDRTKVAVWSRDDKVDSQGACIGMRGTRVKNIMRELRGEKVDIIRWQDNMAEYVAAALAPATIAELQPDEAAKRATVTVEDDQLSIAIGKKGQNVRLASRLTGWEIEIKSRSQINAPTLSLRSLRGVGPSVEERLKEGGIQSVEQLAGTSVETLSAIKGVGEKTAEKLIESAKEAMIKGALLPAATEPGTTAEQAVVGEEVPEPGSGRRPPPAEPAPEVVSEAPPLPPAPDAVDEPTPPAADEPPASSEATPEAGDSETKTTEGPTES